ncbi:MAG TPA: condensation domain-containing protein, partial [Hymenobacter sp.]|nr:condensation domain-containing protein [Hymenobacter sp.]
GGVQLARGYLNKPALTADTWVAIPPVGQSTLYKTGDLVRWQPDGNIEFLGRADEQVKIRGYRVELGEIETRLLGIGPVKQAAVAAIDHGPGKMLVAYVVLQESITPSAMKEALLAFLPDFMIPAHIIELDQLPLTNHGKIDKKALPRPETLHQRAQALVAPDTPLEEQLCAVWQKLLNLEQVGVHDNFFELGGDSIIALQAVSRIRKLGYALRPADVFTHQTIASLAHFLANHQVACVGEQGILTGEVPLLPIQQRFFAHAPEEVPHYNQDFLLALDKSVTATDLAALLQALLDQHDALRLQYEKSPTGWKQFYGKPESQLARVCLADVRRAELPQAITRVCDQHQATLNPVQGEVVKWVFIETPAGEERNRLLVVIHHLAVDGVSWRILLEDMAKGLHLLKAHQPVNLGPKTSSLRAWATEMQTFANGSRAAQQLKFWETQLKNYVPLPVDKVSGGSCLADTETHVIYLSPASTAALLHEANRAYNTEINDLLLSALVMTVHDWAGPQPLVIGLEGHGREAVTDQLDVSNTVGWFTSIYPVALATDHPSIGQTIKAVKEALRSIPNKGIGYGALKYLNPAPAIQEALADEHWDFTFNYLGQFDNLEIGDGYLYGAGESTGQSRHQNTPFLTRLEINGSVS